jgi:thiol-disulfide isomerase/thioredoxin
MDRTFRIRLLHVGVAAAAGVVLAACGTGPGSTAVPGSMGTSAAASGLNFRATTLAGAAFEASSLRGRPVALWFWAPWCTICRAEAPTVAKVAAAFDGRVTTVGVAGQGTVEQMNAFVTQTNTGAFTHLADVRGAIWRQYQVVSQPSFVFVRANGQVDLYVGSLDERTLATLMSATARDASGSPSAGMATHSAGSHICASAGSSGSAGGSSAGTGSLACGSSGPHPTPTMTATPSTTPG